MEIQTVLIVQPEILVRHPLAEYLRQCGYRVYEAVTVTEARTFAMAENIQFDVVLIDVSTTGKDGFELSHWLRTVDRKVEVIITGSVKTAVAAASTLCDQGPTPDKTAQHRAILAKIQKSISAPGRRKA